MSVAVKITRTKSRATMAVNMIKSNSWENSRQFDTCFEMVDGNEVMDSIIQKARTDRELAVALKRDLPDLGDGEYNKRMHEAIEECLNPLTPINFNEYTSRKQKKGRY
ncbi:hypothetical protein QTG56_24420 (plasmid) [Rossellomorea sp. AcN35-11]|nr:hypothetical protein [Rossellomorea aquimaris]WJV31780.1 hypothetical protein QTG56_24420 [Rossellomorea sp. AcN35-11]